VKSWLFRYTLDRTAKSVGLGPVHTVTTTPFWPFRNDESGLDKTGWLSDYLDQHGRFGRFGRSRAAIERFLPLIAEPVIELNAHAKQTARLAALAMAHRTTEVLRCVMQAVRPAVVICAGDHAFRATQATQREWPMEVLRAKHFIYWGRESEAALAAKTNALLRRNALLR
jgi:hypothetical protein